jgi:hypothetical protein
MIDQTSNKLKVQSNIQLNSILYYLSALVMLIMIQSIELDMIKVLIEHLIRSIPNDTSISPIDHNTIR